MKERTPRQLENELKLMYDVSDVNISYNYWFTQLLRFCVGIFQWDNIPDTAEFSARDIELLLLLTGHAYIFMREGKMYTLDTSIYDFDVNYQPTNFVYANPVIGSRQGKIDAPYGDIIYNSPLKDNILGLPVDGSLRSFLGHYARQLADISSSINIYAVNSRIVDYPIAKNDSMKKSLINFFNKRKIGQSAIIWQNDEILDAFGSVPRSNRTTPDTLKDMIDAEDRMLEKFYRDIGIKFRLNKQAQINTEEVESDEQLLLISVDDMLKCRKEGIEKINEKLGSNISVKINPKYDRSLITNENIVEGGNENGRTDDNNIN